MGSWYLVILVVGLGYFADKPPPQVWGPFWSEQRCVEVLRAALNDSASESDWVILDATCVEGPTPPREMEVRWQFK